jgi:hypothetical protein
VDDVDAAPVERLDLADPQPGHRGGEVERPVDVVVVAGAGVLGERPDLVAGEVADNKDARVIPASQRLYDAIIGRTITLPASPELAQHAARRGRQDTRRGWRIDRPNPRVEIDGITALRMAVDRLHNRPEPVQVLGWL